MDGSHIPIVLEDERHAKAFRNYTGYCSIVLLAVVDQRRRFRWVNVGASGCNADSGILESSGLWARVRKMGHQLFAVGHYLLGDSAFGLCGEVKTYRAPDCR